MNNLNNILIEGNLVREPLLRSTSKGTPVCTLRLASNRYYKQDMGFGEETCFFEVETWAKLAEHCYHVGHKGQGIRVAGRLKQDRWKGRDGKSRSRITIVAEHIAFKPEFNRDGGISGRSGIPEENTEESDGRDGLSGLDYAGIREAGETETMVF